MKHWPFKVIAKEGDKPHIRITFKGESKEFSPEEISAMVLIKMKETAEAFLGATVNNAVITGMLTSPFFIFRSTQTRAFYCVATLSCVLFYFFS